ncbi:hypothetical protein DSO57_1029347 [Entomophthora muscae]|uniref:Uncharacterized protein n=1 Tax=Entomophthora muscae TaxID=34485 RepID=A0ACC2UAY3_9FUNG|nr:hypothetical protein DSO57_1029347 [Entomophthora muscae]
MEVRASEFYLAARLASSCQMIEPECATNQIKFTASQNLYYNGLRTQPIERFSSCVKFGLQAAREGKFSRSTSILIYSKAVSNPHTLNMMNGCN